MDCETAIQEYVGKLQANFACRPTAAGLKLITPYLYPDNDLVEIYVQELPDDRVRVTDLGEATRHLHTQGFDVFASTKRKFLAETAVSRVNARLEKGAISKEGTIAEVGEIIFDVVAAARGLAGLIYTSRAYEPAPFTEEVEEFLRDRQIEFQRKHELRGQSGRPYKIPFFVRDRVYLYPISAEFHRALKPRVDAVIRLWVDVDNRAKKFSLLNDVDFQWPEHDVLILSRFSTIYRWTAREGLASDLKAA